MYSWQKGYNDENEFIARSQSLRIIATPLSVTTPPNFDQADATKFTLRRQSEAFVIALVEERKRVGNDVRAKKIRTRNFALTMFLVLICAWGGVTSCGRASPLHL